MANFCTSCGEALAGRAQRPCAGCGRPTHQECLGGGLCDGCQRSGAQAGPALEPPAAAQSCPHCHTPARPSGQPQTCTGCNEPFVLYAGPALDPSLAIHSPTKPVTVKWSGSLTVKSATAGPAGVGMGTMDPILGVAAIDGTTVPWAEVCSVALSRKVLVAPLILSLILLLPLGTLIVVASDFDPIGLLFGVPFLLWGVWVIYRSLVVRGHWMRVVGLRRTLTLRYDGRLWKRKRFLDAVLTGCGHSPGDH